MPEFAVNGAVMACSFGATPVPLVATPGGAPVQIGGQPAATTWHFIAPENIPSFGMCMSLANPQVAAATSAALGVLTPQPCIPQTASPWMPGAPTVTINGEPALTAPCTAMCNWAGEITITSPGQATVTTGG